MSELDKWFPRDDSEKMVEPPKPQKKGVIPGFRRKRKKQYGRRWHRRSKKQNRDGEK